MQQIKRGIYHENTYLGVTLGALVFPYGTILIDAPLRPEDARSWRSALLNQRGGANRVLISLDAHLDRTLGARAMDCSIITHIKTAQIYRNRPTIFKGQSPDSGSEWETYNEAIGTRWSSPDITFTDRMSLHWGGAEIVLEHHPGPAAGSIWVVIPEEEVIFVGDTVTPNQPPFLASAELKEWFESVDLLLKKYLNFTIISGRGGPVALESVHVQRKFLDNIEKLLGGLAKENAGPEATESVIPDLLADLDLPEDRREQYVQRLRSGLYQYYTRRYRGGINPLEQIRFEEGEH
jgi:glyoxylase-like metal-dependent hydrolase (beta-lactamase superfamily II)